MCGRKRRAKSPFKPWPSLLTVEFEVLLAEDVEDTVVETDECVDYSRNLRVVRE
jgi:hypothetical protein